MKYFMSDNIFHLQESLVHQDSLSGPDIQEFQVDPETVNHHTS